MVLAATITMLILVAVAMTPVLSWAATAQGKLPIVVCGALGAISVVAYWLALYGGIPLIQVVR